MNETGAFDSSYYLPAAIDEFKNPFEDPAPDDDDDPLKKGPPEGMVVGLDKIEKKERKKKVDKNKDKDKKRDVDKERLKFEKVKRKDDPLETVNFSKPNGKIEVKVEDKAKKYKYYIMALKSENPYYNSFEWTLKGVVRKRFEMVSRKVILKKGTKLKDLKLAIKDTKESYKKLIELVGPLPSIKKEINM